jgi:proline iminopeptidase
MDRLSKSYRLIYYDQRGRGLSGVDIPLEEISIETELQDLDDLRRSLRIDKVAILGHSWGGYLAMEYAIRYPDRVSHMILMNTAIASHEDYMLFQQERHKRMANHVERLKALTSSAKYMEGDPQTVAEYYRIKYSVTIKQPERLKKLNLNFKNFTKEGILRAREIEKRLLDETWFSKQFNLIPKLKKIHCPTLIIHGDYDFVPVTCVAHIAEAISDAHFVLLEDCGHFAYLESPNDVRSAIDYFMSDA